MQSIVGRAELAISVQPHRRAAELSGLLHIVLLYEVGNGRQCQHAALSHALFIAVEQPRLLEVSRHHKYVHRKG